MSLNGQTQTYMPPTLDGLNIVEADQIYVDGVELDPANLVPYTGANKTLNMNSQAIKTTYAPVVDADVVNLVTLQNAITYIDNINVANFVKYTGSNQNVDLGSNNLTVGNAGLTSFSNVIKTELNNVLAGYTPASITVGNNFGLITNAGGVYQATSTGDYASLVLGAPPSGEKYSVSLSLKSVDVNNNTNLFLYGSTTANMTGSTGMITSFSIPPNTTGFTVFTNTITFPVGSTYLLLVYSSQKLGGIDTLYWNAFTMTGVGSVVKNLIAPSTGLDATNKTYVDTQDALRVPYSGATSNVVLTGTNKFQQSYNATISDTTTLVNRQTLDAAIASSSGSFPFTGATNINGGLQTLQNPMQYNSTLDANNYFVTGVAPTTYIFSTEWIVNPVAGTTANISLDSAVFYFSTSIKYVITFTGIYGTSASWTGTVFNNTTSTTVSDAPIAITTSSQTLSMTFTSGSNNPTIYLRFVGASGTLRWTNFTIKEVDTEVMGNLIIDSQINSNIVQANGKTANLANGLKVNQTSIATASSLTTASLPAGVSASTLSGTYTLTATAGGATFGMWLGSSFTYTAGAKYNYSFTGFSTNATATQAMLLYTNTYSGGAGTMIGDYVVNVPITSSTVSGSFTATSNNNVVWNFVGSAAGKSVSFSGFTLTRADTQMTGIITATAITTDTPITTIGLNSSNQLVKYANPIGGSISTTYVPYASSTNVLANSYTTLGLTDLGYTAASFTAGTGIGSITYSAPTYTANSSASYQGIINLPALADCYLNLPCIAAFSNLAFPLFAVAPYPYFTLTNGSTVVYTSAVGASGTIYMPFIPTATALFVTIYFKAPATPFTGAVLTWTKFTIGVGTMLTNGKTTTGSTNTFNLPAVLEASSSPPWSSSNRFGGSFPLYPAQICALHPSGQALYMGSFYTSGVNQGSVIQSSSVYSGADHNSLLALNPNGGFVGIGAIVPTGTLDVNGIVRMGNYSGGSYDNIQFQRGTGASDYPNINCQDNFFGLYTSTAGGWCGDSQVGDMVMRPSNGRSFRVGIYGGNTAFVVYSNNNVGVGLATPTSKLTVQGNTKIQGASNTNSGDNTGGHLLHYTSADSYAYPTISHFNYNHSNMAVMFDMYYAGAWLNSTSGTGYMFYKQGDYLSTYYGASGSAGGSMSLNLAHEISNTGVNRYPNQPYTFLGQGGSNGSVAYGVGGTFGYSGYACYLTPYQQIGFTNTPGNGWVSYYGTFTAPWQGRYQVDITFYWNSFVAGNRWGLGIYNSGGTMYYNKYCCIEGAGIAADTVRPYGTTIYMNAGDYFQIKLNSGSGTCNAYFGGETHSSMTVAFLG
jgi:hypothetical protein